MVVAGQQVRGEDLTDGLSGGRVDDGSGWWVVQENGVDREAAEAEAPAGNGGTGPIGADQVVQPPQVHLAQVGTGQVQSVHQVQRPL